MQDYYCDLSPIQQQLYEDFSRIHVHKNVLNSEETDNSHPLNKNNMLQVCFKILSFLLCFSLIKLFNTNKLFYL